MYGSPAWRRLSARRKSNHRAMWMHGGVIEISRVKLSSRDVLQHCFQFFLMHWHQCANLHQSGSTNRAPDCDRPWFCRSHKSVEIRNCLWSTESVSFLLILCIHVISSAQTKRKRKGSSSDNPIVHRRECRSNFKLSVSLCPLLFWQPELFFHPWSPCEHGIRVHGTSAHCAAGMSLYPFSLSEHLLTS